VAAAVRRSYIDALMPTILKATDRSATTVVPVYYDYQLRVDVDLAGDDQLFVLAFGSDDSLDVATNEPEDPVEASLDSRISFHRVLAGWRTQITDRLSSRFTPSVGVDYVTFDAGQAGVSLTALNINAREDLEYRVNRRARLRFGVDMELENGNFEAQVPTPKDYRNPGGRTGGTDETQTVEIKGWQFGIGFYGDVILDVTDRLQLIPGARLEVYRYFGNDRLSAEPRLTARYRILDKTTLKAAAGLYSRPPEPREVNDTWGNPNLNLEHAAQLSAGVEQQLLPALSLDAQLYYNHGYDRAVQTRQVRVASGRAEPLRYTNEGNSRSYGLELILKHNVTERFYGWLAYTLARSERTRLAGEDLLLTGLDQTHILTLVASVRVGWGFEIGTRFRLVSGRPDTPVLGSYFDNDRDRYLQLFGETQSERLPLFHQLDLRIERTWLFELWRLSIYLDIQNIYNAENPEAILYDYRFKESDVLRGLPILPTLGIRGSF